MGGLVRSEVPHPRSREVFEAFCRWVGVDGETSGAAADAVWSGRATGLLMSGPQGSGKDTLCPAVLAKVGLSSVHCRVAHAIRSEIDTALDVMRSASSRDAAIVDVADVLRVPVSSAILYVDELFDGAVSDGSLTSESRSAAMRAVLQHHGSDARAAQPGYWVKIAYRKIIPLLADGVSVHLTDGRFPAEIDAGRAVGLFCVRLYVPLEVRRERIVARDGIEPDMASLLHPGEVAGDGYWGLDLEVVNVADADEVASVIADRFGRHRQSFISG